MKSGHPPNQDILLCNKIEGDYPWCMLQAGAISLSVSFFVSCQNETALYVVNATCGVCLQCTSFLGQWFYPYDSLV